MMALSELLNEYEGCRMLVLFPQHVKEMRTYSGAESRLSLDIEERSDDTFETTRVAGKRGSAERGFSVGPQVRIFGLVLTYPHPCPPKNLITFSAGR